MKNSKILNKKDEYEDEKEKAMPPRKNIASKKNYIERKLVHQNYHNRINLINQNLNSIKKNNNNNNINF